MGEECKTSGMKNLFSRSLPLVVLATLAAPAAASSGPATSLAPQRVEGNPRIVPEHLTTAQIARAGKPAVIGVFDVCVDRAGAVTEVRVVRSTTFAAYDAKIQRQIRSWRYQPVLLDGQAAAGCTTVTLVYHQK